MVSTGAGSRTRSLTFHALGIHLYPSIQLDRLEVPVSALRIASDPRFPQVNTLAPSLNIPADITHLNQVEGGAPSTKG